LGGTGCEEGAIGGGTSAALTPFIANAVLDGNTQVSPAQAAIVTALAGMVGGVAAGVAGANAQAGVTFAANEAQNNCLNHPETCTQMAKSAASGVWNGLVSVGEVVANIPNGGPFASPGDPGYISLDGLRLPYTPGDQIGPGSAFFTAALVTKGVGGAVADGEAETLATSGARASASSYVPTAGDVDLPNVYSAQVQGVANSVGTPYGPAFQSYTPAALSAIGQVQQGATLFRIGTLGQSQAAEAQFWSLQNPLTTPNYPGLYGIPPENVTNANFVETAILQP